ncbi:MAG TPA: YajG family lipoprotein [Steroidobacteraceae bacterium]|nr:YajG family lipoprotein [Steroidobacteraceae bacterium]
MKLRIGLMLLAMTLGGGASAAKLLENVSLQWRPTSDLELGTVQMSQATIQFDNFTDARENKTAVGENIEDKQPKPVTTQDDIGAFVGKHMRDLFQHAGFKVVDSDGAVIIKGEVVQFFVREESTYKSEVRVRLTVVNRDGKTLWNGLASGEATRFGRSYKLENYDEALSDGVVNTVSSMLQDSNFEAALSGH